MVLSQVRVGESDRNLQCVYQINIDYYDYFKKNEFIYRTSLIEEKFHLVFSKFLKIININMEFLAKLFYNEIEEREDYSLERLLYIFVCEDRKKLDKLYEDNKVMDDVRKKMDNLTKALEEDLYYDYDDFREKALKESAQGYYYSAGLENGKIEGKALGQQEEKEEIAKSMLKDCIDMAIIQKYTGLSMEEIEKLKKEK